MSKAKIFWKLELKPESHSSLPVLSRDSSKAPSNTLNGADVTDLKFKTYNNESEYDYINIVDDFAWNKSPVSARSSVPQIYLHERRILVNNQISNMAYSLFATLDGGASIINQLSQGVNAVTGNATAGVGDSVVNTGSKIVDSAVSLLKESPYGKALVDNMEKIKNGLTPPQFNNPALQPYNGLYLTESTGFNYILPYLDNNYFESSASYGTGSDESVFSSIMEIPGQIADIVKNVSSVVKPGRYIEKAKQFAFGDNGRSINVKFPLLNTGKYEDILQNWQFIFALIYQNRPGRYDKNVIDLPVIYAVEIPGVIALPYAFISSLNIEFMGTRRTMTLSEIPKISANGVDVKQIVTIVPDAYQITLTLTGLNEETRNFLYAGLQQNQITVSQPPTK